jgi:hypothetical protein
MKLPTLIVIACGRAYADGRANDLSALLDEWATTLPVLAEHERKIRQQIAEHPDGFIRRHTRPTGQHDLPQGGRDTTLTANPRGARP